MVGRHKCVDCGRQSPETNGEITLTTSFGWRIRRAQPPGGEAATEWRCPACWARFKAQQTADGSTIAPPSSTALGGSKDPKR